MSTHVSRRRLMQALTAGLVSAPAALSLWGGPARAHADPPRRLVIFWTANGVVQPRFFPNAVGDPITGKEILAPLAPHADDLIVLRSRYGGNGDHKVGLPYSTTGRPKVIADDPEAGISIDQEIAGAVGDATPRPSLTLCGQSKDNRRGFISANADGSRNPPIREPAKAYEYMLGPYMGGGEPSDGPDALLQKSILDQVTGELVALQPRLSAAERIKLEQHLDGVRELELGVGGIDCDTDNPISPDADHGLVERIQLHNDLIATSFACDLTRVVSFMTTPAGHDNASFGFLGVEGALHGPENTISHRASKSFDPSDSSQLNEDDDKMTLIHTWMAEQLAYLIERLKAIPEGEGTVFDNTAILWANEVSIGPHGHDNIPVVIAGKLGGFLKAGSLYAPDEFKSGTGYRSVLTTLARGMGHEIDNFGEGEACGVAEGLMA